MCAHSAPHTTGGCSSPARTLLRAGSLRCGAGRCPGCGGGSCRPGPQRGGDTGGGEGRGPPGARHQAKTADRWGAYTTDSHSPRVLEAESSRASCQQTTVSLASKQPPHLVLNIERGRQRQGDREREKKREREREGEREGGRERKGEREGVRDRERAKETDRHFSVSPSEGTNPITGAHLHDLI